MLKNRKLVTSDRYLPTTIIFSQYFSKYFCSEFQTNLSEVSVGDWVVVSMPLDNRPGSKNFIAQIVRVRKGKFLGNFLRSVFTKQNTGYVYSYPNIADKTTFGFNQIKKKIT